MVESLNGSGRGGVSYTCIMLNLYFPLPLLFWKAPRGLSIQKVLADCPGARQMPPFHAHAVTVPGENNTYRQ